MNQQEIITKLKAPFSFKEIEWRVLNTTQDKLRGMVAAYVDNRAIQTRLDEAVGAYNWCNKFESWQDKAQICGISIYCEERKEWITKYDGADNSDYEPVKGGLSDSMKRAAVQWGIGRYLYQLNNIWVEIEQRGKNYGIKQDQYSKLEADYNKSITAIFNETPSNKNSVSTTVKTPTKDNPQPQTLSPINNNTPQQTPPPANNNTQTATEQPVQYKVNSVKPSGNSQLIEISDNNNRVVKAYVKHDNAIVVGACLRNVDISVKDGKYGKYNMIDKYELAA